MAAPANTDLRRRAVLRLRADRRRARPTPAAPPSASRPTDTIKVDQPRIYYGELATPTTTSIVGKAADGARPRVRPARPATASSSSPTPARAACRSARSFRRLLYATALPRGELPALRRVQRQLQGHLRPQPAGAGGEGGAVPHPRRRPVPGGRRRPGDLDPRRLHHVGDLPVLAAGRPARGHVRHHSPAPGTVLQAKQNINYIRNSVKATVDAYDGTVTLYKFDDSDPILKAWNKAFGGNLIKPRSAIPAELAAHFRYPEDLFKVQRDLLSKFHVSDPRQFNSGQDFWQVPDDPAADRRRAASSRRTTCSPSSRAADRQPVPADRGADPDQPAEPGRAAHRRRRPRRPAAAGAAGAAAGGPHPRPRPGPAEHGQRRRRAHPRSPCCKGRAPRPRWCTATCSPCRTSGGMLYVQPVYVKSANVANPFPLMRLVLVSYGNEVGFGNTLKIAIDDLVKKASASTGGPPVTGTPGEPGALTGELAAAAAKIDAAIKKLHDAQASGDFTAYAQALEELEAAVKEFQAAAARATAAPSPSPSG